MLFERLVAHLPPERRRLRVDLDRRRLRASGLRVSSHGRVEPRLAIGLSDLDPGQRRLRPDAARAKGVPYRGTEASARRSIQAGDRAFLDVLDAA